MQIAPEYILQSPTTDCSRVAFASVLKHREKKITSEVWQLKNGPEYPEAVVRIRLVSF